jgi:hypothetical protein
MDLVTKLVLSSKKRGLYDKISWMKLIHLLPYSSSTPTFNSLGNAINNLTAI